jgi:hypothetical protein
MDLLLAGPGPGGNEAFLGIGVIGWVLIIAIAVGLWFFMSRRSGRRL